MAWQMYAGRVEGGFRHFGSRWYVEAYGHPEAVAVQLTESPDGAYWGWLDTGSDEPEMIWPDRLLFDACFTYGPDKEVASGKGRILRLDVQPVSEPAPCRCMANHAYIAPMHAGHCCFQPATQTCHQAEMRTWEDEHRRHHPGWEPEG